MKAINAKDIERISSQMKKKISEGDGFESMIEELNSILLQEYGISARKSIVKYCRDNFRDVTPLIQPILTEIINQLIIKAIDEGENEITICNPGGLYNLAEGIRAGITIRVNGPVGGSFGAYNNGARLICHGVAGRYCGNNAWSGLFVLYEDVDEGFGLTNYGADFIIFGKAMARGFAQARGGSALVRNGLVDYAGMYMADGVLVCFDGELGSNIGSGMVGGAIYVPKDRIGGRTVGDGAVLVERLEESDFEKLREVFQRYRGIEGVSFEFSKTFPIAAFNGHNYSTEDLVKIVSMSGKK